MTNEEKLKSLSTKEFARKIWLYMSCGDCPIKAKCYENNRNCAKHGKYGLKVR